MSFPNRCLSLAVLGCIAACATPSTTDTTPPPSETTPQPVEAQLQKAERVRPPAAEPRPDFKAMTFGRGIAKADGLDVNFKFNISVYVDGTAEGTFSHSAMGPAGSLDLEGEVTCVHLQNEAGRGWIGGKLTRNDSSDPRYTAAEGADVWFRILDRNIQKMHPMIGLPMLRDGRIRSAQKFCKAAQWSDDGLYLVDPGALAIFP